MLHHVSFGVADLQRSGAFYDAALSPLGYVRVWTDATAMGFGRPGEEDQFALKLDPVSSTPSQRFHLAFAAPTRESVARFHQAALRCGGRDDGAPALCPEYGEYYYAAFVIDPDGYRVEAVINEPL